MTGSLAYSWAIWNVRTRPRRNKWCGFCPVTFSPSRKTWPAVGGNTPAMMLNRVDLPAPFGPIRPVIDPAATVSEQSSTAVRPPNRFVTP